MKHPQAFALRRSVRIAILGFLRETAKPPKDEFARDRWDTGGKTGIISGPGVDEIVAEECDLAEEILRAGWSPSGRRS